jgi:hypothetical protein
MIFVNQLQLDQVKYLLEQSVRGNHILFQAETIKKVASTPKEVDSARTELAEKILEEMILRDTLSKKKLYLESLDRDLYEDVVRVYMNIVQNTAQDSQGFTH